MVDIRMRIRRDSLLLLAGTVAVAIVVSGLTPSAAFAEVSSDPSEAEDVQLEVPLQDEIEESEGSGSAEETEEVGIANEAAVSHADAAAPGNLKVSGKIHWPAGATRAMRENIDLMIYGDDLEGNSVRTRQLDSGSYNEATGNYSFAGLVPGEYMLTAFPIPGVIKGDPYDLSLLDGWLYTGDVNNVRHKSLGRLTADRSNADFQVLRSGKVSLYATGDLPFMLSAGVIRAGKSEFIPTEIAQGDDRAHYAAYAVPDKAFKLYLESRGVKVYYDGTERGTRNISHALEVSTSLLQNKKLSMRTDCLTDIRACNASKPGNPNLSRLAGDDRFSTSARISAQNFGSNVPVVFIANGMNFADALAGASAATKLGGPVLLTRSHSLPNPIAAELRRLKPKKIVVLGGTGVISSDVESGLQLYTASKARASVERWSGSNRYATAAKISAKAFAKGVPVAYIAAAGDFPDALSGAPVAGMTQGPVLLIGSDGIAKEIDAELKRLQAKKIVVLGGTGAIPSGLEKRLQQYTVSKTKASVERWSGSDRFATSAAISAKSLVPRTETVYIANGMDFPDALSAAPVAGLKRAPVLLVRGSAIPGGIKAELKRLQPTKIVVVGGAGAVSATVAMQLEGYLVP